MNFFLLFVALQASATPLFEVQKEIPDAVVDLRYATPNNFLDHAVYPQTARCLLTREALDKLKKAAEALRGRKLRLKAWDCYRPLSVQKQMWKLFPHPGYVANPQ